MKKWMSLGVLLMMAGMISAAYQVKSPDGKLSLNVSLSKDGSLNYEVLNQGKKAIANSPLGFEGDVSFVSGLKVIGSNKAVLSSETYVANGEKRFNRTFAVNTASLQVQNQQGKIMQLELKATNDGVAFRYVYHSDVPVAIRAEKTGFKLMPGTRAWLHPQADAHTGWAQTQPSYEEQYEYNVPAGTASPQKAGWSFPTLFKSDNQWVMLTEAGLTPDYVGARLAQNSEGGLYKIAFPQMLETVKATDPNYPVSKNITTPWRVIVVGSLSHIVESQMVSDLAAPADTKIDYSWVKPGISSWSWGVLHDDATVYPVQKQFIEYASQMKWEYCLVDADWDWKIGYDKIKELSDYAKTLNVKLLLWYNSSGSWNSTVYTPKNALLDREARRKEFARIHEMGIAGVKVDFWPGDGQSTIQYYYDLLADAADAHLMVNFHGTTVPRGWSRTFPNLVAMESIRGFEFTTFDQKDTDLAPKHLTMMPYARNVVGPMDFTPVCFGEIKGKTRKTSNAFELALSVVLQSGIQHYVEIPESMAQQPEYVRNYLSNIPRKWEDVKLLDGFPGEFVVMARKSAGKWYVGAINSTPSVKKISLNLKDLGLTSADAKVITDGDNNRSFRQYNASIQNNILELELQPSGGASTQLQ